MANAVLLATLGLAMILFGIQEFLDPAKRKVASLVIRAVALLCIGLYLIYLYQEMSGSNMGMRAPAYGPAGLY